ncbi:hypothetical protein [Aquimarina sp. AU119]|uniref:hypothetical protein n=1 Tax=Aquimarina sp. AU119 TaxID=2108528 RepID=UPI00135AC679|nr:hypothetical protein [Aquimarina sp. AU119]
MKTIKTLLVILFLGTLFVACEADSVNDEIGIDGIETFGSEEAHDAIPPTEGEG